MKIVILFSLIFFHAFIFSQKLPIPSDTIVGLYHPFRDLYAKEYSNGTVYKNFLLTDPVRQQYPWRNLVVESFKNFQLPLWNPYNFSGTPLLANIQSAPFYPPNVLFFFLPFSYAWSVLVIMQPLLAGIFLYLYLRNVKITHEGSILGAISFAFSGFFIAWLEWGTVIQVALWLPLLLLSIDKLVINKKHKVFGAIFLFSLISAFFAGHLQIFFYLFLFVWIYFLARWFQYKRNTRILLLFIILNSLFIILTFIQWYPTLQLILQSARNVDQSDWTKVGWFIPWHHLVQFLAPDFFGNPATLNYWSDWNYGEFVGYIGILPLLMAIFALFFRKDKKTLFFGTMVFVTLFFAFPTPLAKLPFLFSLPFISTAQPTRLLFLIDFSLAVLAAFGVDYFLKQPKKIFYPLGIIGFFFGLLWITVLYGQLLFPAVSIENFATAKRNLLLPLGIFIGVSMLCFGYSFFPKKAYTIWLIWLLIGITAFDLFRFGTKFIPFTSPAYLYPSTTVTQFLQKQTGQFRMMTTDSRIFPPNFSAMYHIQSVDGYDPLYLRHYGELIAASERKKPDISPPFGFNRIITPHNFDSKIIDLLNVKYVLSLSDIDSPKLKKIFQEGQTRIYENRNVLPRVFFVKETKLVKTKQESINLMLNRNTNLLETAIIELKKDSFLETAKWSLGTARISRYEGNRVIVQTDNAEKGFLVLADMYYPTWHVTIDGKQSDIVRTDYLLRGVIIPRGKHTIVFSVSLL